MDNVPTVHINEKRFLVVDGIPLFKVTENGTIEVKDKDGRRSRRRGSAYVETNLADIQTAIRYDFLRSR